MRKIVLILTILFIALPVCAATIKVGPNLTTGCDGGACDYTTIQAGINAASKGDVVELYDNAYSENIVISANGSAWTAGNYYTLRPASGNSSVSINGPTAADETIDVNGNYWQIGDHSGCTGTGSAAANCTYPQLDITQNTSTHDLGTINTGGATNVRIQNVEVQGGTSGYGIRGDSNGPIEISYSVLHNGGEIVRLNTSGVTNTYNKIYNSEIYDCDQCVKMSRNYYVSYYNNYFRDINGGSYDQAIYLRDQRYAKVYSNVFYNLDRGVYLFEDVNSCDDVEIYNNTFDTTVSDIYFAGPSGISGVLIKNNLFYDSAIALANTGAHTGTYDYNYCYSCTTFKEEGGLTDGGNNTDSNNVPNITGSSTRPDPFYDLTSNSPLGDGGTDDDTDIPDTDFNGDSRNGTQWIGAFEYEIGTAVIMQGTWTIKGGDIQ